MLICVGALFVSVVHIVSLFTPSVGLDSEESKTKKKSGTSRIYLEKEKGRENKVCYSFMLLHIMYD